MRASTLPRRPLLALAVVLVVAALGLGRPPAAQAAPDTRTGHEFFYYSDNTYTDLVGYQVWCIGYHSGWGTTTPYVDMEDYPYCPNG